MKPDTTSTGGGKRHGAATEKVRFRFPGRAALEQLGDRALLFLPDSDRLVTLNRAAAELLELSLAEFPGSSFDVTSLGRLLAGRYRLTGPEASRQAAAAIDGWLAHGICREVPRA